MDFTNNIKQLGVKVLTLKEQTLTEEATKNAFIMPFIQILGYDIFNPCEVVPEYVCDIGTKKGEKIDYAIIKDDSPILLIECKHWKQELSLHDNQLLRYFGVSKAKFGVLTNGIVYKFYTDLENINVMDKIPFLEIDITNAKDSQIEELKKFHKTAYNESNIIETASDLKYSNEMLALLQREISNPSDGLVKLFAKEIYKSKVTDKYLEYFTHIFRKAFNTLIADIISDRLKAALDSEKGKTNEQGKEDLGQIPVMEPNEITTTDEELEGFYIVKSIIREIVDSSRISYKDTKSYFAILIDGNVRKTVCRLYFERSVKWLMIVDENKDEERNRLSSLDDIYLHKNLLIESVKRIIK